jgi:hypothetical protein
MPIGSVISLLAALIGLFGTLLAAWVYIRSQHLSKREIFRATLVISIITVGILGLAVLISRATTISINGQQTLPRSPTPAPTRPSVPAPGFLAPGEPTPSPKLTPSPSPKLTPSPSSTLTPSPSPALTPSPSSTLTPSTSPALTPTSLPSPSPTSVSFPKPTKTPFAHLGPN